MFAMVVACGTGWAAGEFPVRAIHVVVPYSAGSTGDVRTRQLAQYLSERFRQPVIVDNKPGAAGALGAQVAARAAPDGYTLLYMSPPRVIVPHLNKNVGFDVRKDLAPIMLMANGAAILVAGSAVPANSIQELVQLAKAKPTLLTYGSSGPGSVQHVPMEMFKAAAGIEILHVPFKGDAETLNSLLGGQVSVSFAAAASVLPHLASARLKALAVGGKRRMAQLPDVPTMTEAGYAEFEWHNWYGYAAPAGTPKSIVDTLNGAMASYLGLARVRQEHADAGFEVAGGTPEEFAALIKRDFARYGDLLRRLGMRPE